MFTFGVKIIPVKYKIVLLACTFALFVASCKKDKDTPQEWNVTPETVYSFLGKDWGEIEPVISNKKTYQYSALTNSEYPVKSYVEVHGVDKAAPCQHYKLFFNVGKDNKVSSLSFECTDTADQVLGNKNFMYFLSHVGLKMQAVTTQEQWLQETYNPQQVVPTETLWASLNVGAAYRPCARWYNFNTVMQITFFGEVGTLRMDLSSY